MSRKAKAATNPPSRGSVASASKAPERGGFDWSVGAAWYALLAAIVVGPLLMVNVTLTPGDGAHAFYSGGPLVKALVIQVLVGVSLACFSLGALRGKAAVRWHPVGWIGAAFVAWSLLTVATASSPLTSLIGYWSNANGWFALATYAAAGFLALQLADTPARIRELLQTTGFTAAAIAVYGLVQTAGADPFKWAPAQWGTFRSFGTLGNPDMFGAYMVLNLFLLAGLYFSESRRNTRIAYGIATFVVAAATFTSLTRAAWLGAIAGAIVLAVPLLRSRIKLTRTYVIVAAVVIAIIAVGTLVSLSNSDVDSNVVNRVTAAFNPKDRNTLGRTETWRIAAAAIAQRPVTGYGPDGFAFAFDTHKTEAFARLVAPNIVQADAHSSPIQLATESGVPAVLLWIGFVVAVAVVATRTLAKLGDEGAGSRMLLTGALASFAGYLVASLLTPASASASLLLWCVAAVLVSPSASSRMPGPLRWIASAGVLLGVLAVGLGVTLLAADVQAAVADNQSQNAPARLKAADAAVRLNPMSSEYAAVAAKAYAQALLQESASGGTQALSGRFQTALRQMTRSVALEPDSAHRRATLVGLYLIGGSAVDKRYNADAVTAAQTGVRLYPNDLENAYWYARALNDNGRGSAAIPALERVLSWRPDYVDAAVLLSDLYVKAGESAKARQLLQRSIPLTTQPEALESRLKALQ